MGIYVGGGCERYAEKLIGTTGTGTLLFSKKLYIRQLMKS